MSIEGGKGAGQGGCAREAASEGNLPQRQVGVQGQVAGSCEAQGLVVATGREAKLSLEKPRHGAQGRACPGSNLVEGEGLFDICSH